MEENIEEYRNCKIKAIQWTRSDVPSNKYWIEIQDDTDKEIIKNGFLEFDSISEAFEAGKKQIDGRRKK
jgi:hypothetical protein